MATYLGSTKIFKEGHADSAILILVDNEADAWLIELTSGAANQTYAKAEDGMAVLAKIVGLTDVTSLSDANFADFSA